MLTLNNRQVEVLRHLLRAVDAQDDRAEEIYDDAQASMIGRARNESTHDEGDPQWLDAEAELGQVLELVMGEELWGDDPMGSFMGANV